MEKKNLVIRILFLIVLYLNNDVYPCTTFCLKTNKDIIFGRNLDFFVGSGYVTINKRNVTKTAFVVPPEKPLTWTSRYGSITFNQIGREFPYGGMNEAGLVIEQMWLDTTKYPESDHRYGLSELQWIQYQLDNSATTDDVIASDSLVRVSFQSQAPLHFLVCDKHGDEFGFIYKLDSFASKWHQIKSIHMIDITSLYGKSSVPVEKNCSFLFILHKLTPIRKSVSHFIRSNSITFLLKYI